MVTKLERLPPVAALAALWRLLLCGEWNCACMSEGTSHDDEDDR